MNVLCEECNTSFSTDESASELEGSNVQCPNCGHSTPCPTPVTEGVASKAERVWFVAINDVQVGPLNLGELEEKFSAGEVDGDSLVWRAGWEDWELARVSSELSYLVEMYEVESDPGKVEPVESPVFEPTTILFDSFVEAEPPRERVGWAPSAASELSNLAAEELNLPESLPKGEGSGGGSVEAPSQVFEQDVPDFRTPQELPSSSQRRSGGGWAWLLVAGVVLGGAWFMQESGRLDALVEVIKGTPGEPSPSVVAKEAPAPSPSAPVVEVIKVPPKEPSKASPKITKVRSNPKPPPGKPAVRQPPARPARPATSRKVSKPSAPKTSALDSVFESSQGVVKERLSKKDIVDGVRANAKTVMGCLKRARKKGEIVPGTHKVILDWTIKADGKVVLPEFKGPVNLMSTSLPACFEASMLQWTFAESRKGAPIRNYPFGPFTVR